MKRNRTRSIAGVAAALLACLALTGCGDRRAAIQPNPTGSQASAVPSGEDDASGSDSAASGASSGSSASPRIPATPDAVASELDQINQLINDIDNSVQNSDSSSQGGE